MSIEICEDNQSKLMQRHQCSIKLWTWEVSEKSKSVTVHCKINIFQISIIFYLVEGYLLIKWLNVGLFVTDKPISSFSYSILWCVTDLAPIITMLLHSLCFHKHERQPIVIPYHQATVSLDTVMPVRSSDLTSLNITQMISDGNGDAEFNDAFIIAIWCICDFRSSVRVSPRNCAPFASAYTFHSKLGLHIRQRSVRVHIRWSPLETINRHYVRRNERLDHTRQMFGATVHDI